MTRGTKDLAASVRQRLLNHAKAEGADYLVILQRYVHERLLYRLTQSKHADRLTLKGASLFVVWSGQMHRATRDLDLLARGDPDATSLVALWRDVVGVDVDDGVSFDARSIRAGPIREGREYEGVRVQLVANVGSAKVALQIDVGFGDAVVPRPKAITLPVLLDMPQPELRAYAPETVVAEKLHAMVEHGAGNTRLKDYFDVCWLFEKSLIDPEVLAPAVAATFRRRRTPLPTDDLPALSTEFGTTNEVRWRAFKRRALIKDARSLVEVIEVISPPLLRACEVLLEP